MHETTEQATLTAPDISCGHCVASIKEAVGELDGVRRVEASSESKQVAVDLDPSRVSLASIEATLDEAGYPVQQ